MKNNFLLNEPSQEDFNLKEDHKTCEKKFIPHVIDTASNVIGGIGSAIGGFFGREVPTQMEIGENQEKIAFEE